MKNYRHLREYSVSEINGILKSLQAHYDHVQLVDVEECRVLEIRQDGSVHYGRECFRIWNRGARCANCSGYRACMTHQSKDKIEHLNGGSQVAHSIPIYLELPDGELELCAIDCVKITEGELLTVPEEIQPELDYIRQFDVLTRMYTQEKLFREVRRRLISRPDTKYLLVMGTVRNFALINKLFGVEGGNRILLGIADALRRECVHGEIYGRCREDRFAVLAEKDRFDEAEFYSRLQCVQTLLDSPIYSVQLQLGIYEIDNDDMPISAMLDHAELALLTIRDAHRERIAHYAPGMMERKLRDHHIITAFEQALRDRDFHMYLQPQVRDDGVIRGGEALVRWVYPNGEVIPPAEFLDVLHQSELLSSLDAYIWEQAARQLGAWRGTEFENLYISVNVDPSDFYYMDVPEFLVGLCRRYGIRTRQLRVEITETALVDDTVNQTRVVERLHKCGFIVEIDDFGKGSSSLSMLKDVQADVLKIDMGFVHGERNLGRSRVILESVIDMAAQLNMGVITEGVETREQVDRLVRMGCHNFQGFYFSRPVPVADFEAVVRASREITGARSGG